MERINIAIDGLSGCGKSSTAREVAKQLGYIYIDSGAMYRVVTLHFLKTSISIANPREVSEVMKNLSVEFNRNTVTGELEIFLDGRSVEDQIRAESVSAFVSEVSAVSEIRKALVNRQRRMGDEKGVVMDGRDIGTVVFPDAELKIFMTADLDVRAERRLMELSAKDPQVDIDGVRQNLVDRDRIDTSREDSPLKRAEDAIDLDTTHVTFTEQVDKVMNMAATTILKKNKAEVDGS